MRVVVEDGLIRRIGSAGGPAGPRDARVIDCQGRTLMPGLLDAHVHLALLDLDPAAEATLPPAVLALRIKNEIEATLDGGFTTVRDAGGLDWGFKEAIRLGLIRGPRIFISGAFIPQSGVHGDNRRRPSRRARSCAVFGRRARRRGRRGWSGWYLRAGPCLWSAGDPELAEGRRALHRTRELSRRSHCRPDAGGWRGLSGADDHYL